MSYEFLKHSHAGLAYLTGLLFVLRFALFYKDPALRNNRILRILPHLIDSALLIFAILLCLSIKQAPLLDAWLSGKVVGLVLYIGFGMIAIKRQQLWAFGLALLSYGYILGAAITHHWLSWAASG